MENSEMKNFLICLSFVIVLFLTLVDTTFGCAVITVPSLTKFDSSEYVFIGKVKGVISPLESTEFHGKAWGLKIELLETVYLPKPTAEYFEVFPFDLESDCKDKGWSKEKLLTYFPTDSNVKVIAKESNYSTSRLANGNIRLEILPDNLGSISRNYLEGKKNISSANSVFDYKTYVAPNFCELTESDYPVYETNSSIPDFEFRKDLLRLNNATNENEKVEILKRLIYFPNFSDDYLETAKYYLKNRKIISSLNKKRKAWKRIYFSKINFPRGRAARY